MFVGKIAAEFPGGRHPFHISLVKNQGQALKVDKVTKGDESLVNLETKIDIEQIVYPAAASLQRRSLLLDIEDQRGDHRFVEIFAFHGDG